MHHSVDTSALVRDRCLVALTLAVGICLLSLTLRLHPGDALFFPGTIALAVVWGGGAWLAGVRLPRWSRPATRSLAIGVLVGAALLALSLLGALIAAQIDALRQPAQTLLDHADNGAIVPTVAVTVVNGIAEELFFRGALYNALPVASAVVVSTVLYLLTTVGSGVALLVVGAAALGLVTAWLRRVRGELLSPIGCHLTWSLGMLFMLPPIFATGR